MKKLAIHPTTAQSLVQNESIRKVSDIVKTAHAAINANTSGAGCSECAKRKQTNAAIAALIDQLKKASPQELDRIKKVLDVDVLVFGDGIKYLER